MPIKFEVSKQQETIGSSDSSSEYGEIGKFQSAYSGSSLGASITVGKEGEVSISGEEGPQADVTRRARNQLVDLATAEQSEQARSILDRIDERLEGLADLVLPEIHLIKAEDGSINMAWNVGDAKLGISIESNRAESHWFLLMGAQDKAMTAYGNLNEMDSDVLIETIVTLIEKYERRQTRNR